MPRETIPLGDTLPDETNNNHWGANHILLPKVQDALLTQHNEHAAALDVLTNVQSITGTTDAEKVASIIAALVALGLATDDTTP